MTAAPRTTRLAPSPTGELHLGNVRTFAFTWALARALGWRVLLRIEDLDAPRVRAGAAEEAESLLDWLGLDHDAPAHRQSEDLVPFRDALAALARRGLVYSCALSRAEVRAVASAPHAGDREQVYPASLRPPEAERWRVRGDGVNYRFATPAGRVEIDDRIAGRREFDPAEEVGDFIVWTRAGVPSYQLAVVVDDRRTGVTDVVRGDDLLPSAARQALLHEALGGGSPIWWHLPLVLDAEGERLAKRRGEAGIAALRSAGVPRGRILGLAARWLDLVEERVELEPGDLVALLAPRLDGDTLRGPPLRTIRCTEEDLRWLRAPTTTSAS